MINDQVKLFFGFSEKVVLIYNGTFQAKRASLRREVLHTDFLTPPILKESMVVLEKLADVKAVAQGGYPQVISNDL